MKIPLLKTERLVLRKIYEKDKKRDNLQFE